MSKGTNRDRPCSIEGCENPARSRGWCEKHYTRWRSHGDPLAIRKSGTQPLPFRPCIVEGCPGGFYAKGMCEMHFQRWKKQGTTEPHVWATDPLFRFTAKLLILPNGCWEWQGTCNPKGYGLFDAGLARKGGPKMVAVHRWSYEHHVGPIPDGLTIDHTCHNLDKSCPGGRRCRHRRCVNPSHLEPVTTKENQARSPHDPAKKTHCPYDHPYDEANTYVVPGKVGRHCRACAKRRRAAYEAKKRARR